MTEKEQEAVATPYLEELKHKKKNKTCKRRLSPMGMIQDVQTTMRAVEQQVCSMT